MYYLQLLSLLCFLLLSVTGYTQTEIKKPSISKNIQQGMVQKEVMELKAKLSLTQAQAQKVETIENQYYSTYADLLNTATSALTRKEKRQQLQEMKEEALHKVLSPKQWTAYVSYIEDRKQKVKQEIEEDRRKMQEANPRNGE